MVHLSAPFLPLSVKNALTALVWLGGSLVWGACTAKHGVWSDAGLTTNLRACSFDSATYVGFVDLIDMEASDPLPAYHLQLFSSGSVQFFPAQAPHVLPPTPLAPALCGSSPVVGQCCTGPLTSNAGGGADSGQVGVEYVTCLDERSGNANGSASVWDPYGGLTWSFWSGGDSLQCSGDGGVVGAFTETLSTPSNFAGLSPLLFPGDSGPAVVSLGQDLVVTWTAGSPSSNVVINLGDDTTELACLAADDGSFSIPAALLSPFQAGDAGFITIFRYQQTCARSVPVSFVIENGVGQSLVFQ